MSSDFSTTENINFEDGELVEAADMLTEAQAARNRSQEIAAAILGTMNWLPALDPLQVATNGSFQLTIGGLNQRIYVQGTWCDYCPATELQCPGSGPVARIDSIAIKAVPLQPDGDTITREVEAADGSKSNQTIQLDANTIALQYVQGSEAPPAGYVELARITVPPNAAGLNAADIELVFPDPRMAITGTDETPVTSVNGQQGDVTIEGAGNVNVDLDGSKVRVTGTPTSVNGNTGAVTIEGDGQIGVTSPAPGTIKINAPAAQLQTTLNGLSGGVTMSGTGIASVSETGQTIKINVPAPPASATINGDGPQAFELEDGNGVHVRRVSTGVFAFDNEGVTHINGENGDLEVTSSDGSLSVGGSGGTIDIKRQLDVFASYYGPQNGSIEVAITLPGTAAETFHVDLDWFFTGIPGGFSAAIYLMSGTMSGQYTNGPLNSGANGVQAGQVLTLFGPAVGGQTLRFSCAISSGSTSGQNPIRLRAARIS